ncbi:MAG: hypothetical protein HY308_09450 [Gammaproteobacteria bacterium]|nr:hypothetical protein [Gammaproteobacteria bacterium]
MTGNLILETSNTGTVKVVYVYTDNLPIAQVKRSGNTETLTYLHTDHEGTPRLGTNASNTTVVWRWEGRAFGETSPTGTATVNLRYAGMYADAESGLFYNWNRYYSPALGRYLTSDPIGLEGGPNTYTYVRNNPLRWTDPSGLCIEDACIIEGIAIGAGARVLLGAIAAGAGAATPVTQQCDDKKCPPCKTVSGKIVPVGTIGYRPLDVIPDNQKQHGVYGSHHNIFIANQMPYPKCDCFWAKQKWVAKPNEIQPTWIPIEPFIK